MINSGQKGVNSFTQSCGTDGNDRGLEPLMKLEDGREVRLNAGSLEKKGRHLPVPGEVGRHLPTEHSRILPDDPGRKFLGEQCADGSRRPADDNCRSLPPERSRALTGRLLPSEPTSFSLENSRKLPQKAHRGVQLEHGRPLNSEQTLGFASGRTNLCEHGRILPDPHGLPFPNKTTADEEGRLLPSEQDRLLDTVNYPFEQRRKLITENNRGVSGESGRTLPSIPLKFDQPANTRRRLPEISDFGKGPLYEYEQDAGLDLGGSGQIMPQNYDVHTGDSFRHSQHFASDTDGYQIRGM